MNWRRRSRWSRLGVVVVSRVTTRQEGLSSWVRGGPPMEREQRQQAEVGGVQVALYRGGFESRDRERKGERRGETESPPAKRRRARAADARSLDAADGSKRHSASSLPTHSPHTHRRTFPTRTHTHTTSSEQTKGAHPRTSGSSPSSSPQPHRQQHNHARPRRSKPAAGRARSDLWPPDGQLGPAGRARGGRRGRVRRVVVVSSRCWWCLGRSSGDDEHAPRPAPAGAAALPATRARAVSRVLGPSRRGESSF
jgi:hypothetical protein